MSDYEPFGNVDIPLTQKKHRFGGIHDIGGTLASPKVVKSSGTGGAGSVGISTTAAREDHVHPATLVDSGITGWTIVSAISVDVAISFTTIFIASPCVTLGLEYDGPELIVARIKTIDSDGFTATIYTSDGATISRGGNLHWYAREN